MNIIFTGHGINLDILYNLMLKLKPLLKLKQAGFYVTDQNYFIKYLKANPLLGSSDYCLLKEWEIMKQGLKLKPDYAILKRYEEEIGDPNLWNALICDRQIYLGRLSTVKQDYQSCFSHEQMLGILQAALERIDEFLGRVKPDVLISLDPVTLGDYLLYLFAKARNIPALFYRISKIKNYITLHEGVFGCSEHIYRIFKQYQENDICDQWIKEAKDYLEEADKEDIRYEGMIPIPSKKRKKRKWLGVISVLGRTMLGQIKYLVLYRNDYRSPGRLRPFIYKNFITPLKAKFYDLKYGRHYVKEAQLSGVDFAFYPMQSEPELASLVWGRSYMNQIEVIRNIARSLPVGMKLLVKEHPRAIGYRGSGYYRKMLQIPNVLLAHPDQEVRPLVKKSKIVISIATFVSFEAIIYKIPTIMLGGPRPFTILPDSMIRYVHSINDLAGEIKDLIKNYRYKELPLLNYIAATIKGSVAVDLFSILLDKKGRYGDRGVYDFGQEIDKLAAYTVKRLESI